MKLTIHDGQFWVGVVEVVQNGRLKAGRYVFGAEPQDQEILDFVHGFFLKFLNGLSQDVAANSTSTVKINPKRMADRFHGNYSKREFLRRLRTPLSWRMKAEKRSDVYLHVKTEKKRQNVNERFLVERRKRSTEVGDPCATIYVDI